MMDFVFKMMNFVFKMIEMCRWMQKCETLGRSRRIRAGEFSMEES